MGKLTFADFLNPIGAIASSLIGGITSIGSQDSANKTNIKLAQTSNDFQREMYDKQVADEWRQIEYNSPVNQVNRFKQAGLNPNLMMNGGSSGNASGSVTTGGNPATAHVDPTFGPSAPSLSTCFFCNKKLKSCSDI